MSFTIPGHLPPPSGSGSDSDSVSDDGGASDWASSLGDARRTTSLFDGSVHPTPEAALAADKAAHGFDLAATVDRLALDLYGRMRLINLIRKEKMAAKDVDALSKDDKRFQDDELLVPVLADDPLLQIDFDDEWSDDEEAGPSTAAQKQSAAAAAPAAPAAAASTSNAEVEALRAEVAALRVVVERTLSGDDENVEGKPRDDDTHYFESYAENDIHEIMLKDTTRTVSYARFIMSNPAVFRDAVVMDVGAGTGILSMLAAKAGAKHVYAIEASGLATKTRDNVRAAGLQDVITVIQGKVEDIELPVKTVDVIVSEWMGYMLLYESMLDSVLWARDKYLTPTGLMVPSQTRLAISAITAKGLYRDHIDFWKNVYGFDMYNAMTTPYFADGLVEVVDKDEVVTSEAIVRDVNSHEATPASLDFHSSFSIACTATEPTTVKAFLTHFDTFFSPTRSHVPPTQAVHIHEFAHDLHNTPVNPLNAADLNAVSFTTGPRGQPTHWKQVAFLLRTPLELKPGQSIEGQFFCRKSEDNSRELDVEIHFGVTSGGAAPAELTVQTFKVR